MQRKRTTIPHGTDEEIKDNLRRIFFANPKRNFTLQELLKALELNTGAASAVKRALRTLVKGGEAVKLKGRHYTADHRTHIRSGKFEPGKFGAGFVRSEMGDLYVPAGYTGTALPDDIVRVEVLALQRGPTPEARIIGVLKRAGTEIVGEFSRDNGNAVVIPDSEFLKRHITIPPDKTRRANRGQRVAVRITAWEDEYSNPSGIITDVIGFPHEKEVGALSLAKAAGIPIRFPRRVLKAAEALTPLRGGALLEGRADFRDEEIFTIDPEDAGDFDDAVSLKTLPDGSLLAGIYIADVTAYVMQGDPIDREAAKRGTSVYLPDAVIHMLPQRLSTDLCSLLPGKDRPVFAVRITCTPQGDIRNYEITEGVIRSRRRFDYSEAQAIIDSRGKSALGKTLRAMNRFAKTLRARRLKEGGIDFYVPEVHFTMNENGVPAAIGVKEILETNNLIEEFMLLANRVAAQHLYNLEKQHRASLPFIYRVHNVPGADAVAQFSELVKALGCPVNNGTPGTSRWFQKILEYFAEKREKLFVEEIALRSMMKAVYQPKNIGHFGLGFSAYTHFTSPIRRYPDLVVHRLLKRYAAGSGLSDLAGLRRRVASVSRHATDMELRAVEAEREAVKMKQLEYMIGHVGDVYHGVVSGVTSFGIFVQLQDILVDGLIHVKDLENDYFLCDETGYRLVGQYTGRSFKLGDSVDVQVIKVNAERGHLDLFLVDE